MTRAPSLPTYSGPLATARNYYPALRGPRQFASDTGRRVRLLRHYYVALQGSVPFRFSHTAPHAPAPSLFFCFERNCAA